MENKIITYKTKIRQKKIIKVSVRKKKSDMINLENWNKN